ncbi:MAG TPA: hypothetical protein VL122_02025 [Nitrospirota bacterium]|nr:hypothetical protein [Nitrospirota bacterium]
MKGNQHIASIQPSRLPKQYACFQRGSGTNKAAHRDQDWSHG